MDNQNPNQDNTQDTQQTEYQAPQPEYQAPQQPYQAPQQPYQAPQQPYQAPQQPYQAPQQPVYGQQPYMDNTTQVLSVGSYIGMFILSAIPIVNIICWIVWLAGSNTNKNKKNYVIASIIMWAISLVISIVLSFLLPALGIAITNFASNL